MPPPLTTSAAAARKGCTRQAIVNAIQRGDLRATRHGRAWVIADDDALAAWAVKETGGRAHRQHDAADVSADT